MLKKDWIRLAVGSALAAMACGILFAAGACDDDGVRSALGLPREQRPLYLVPVGKPREPRHGR